MSDNNGTALAPVEATQAVVVCDAPAVGLNIGNNTLVPFEAAFALAAKMAQAKIVPEAMRSEGAIIAAMLLANQTRLPLMSIIHGSHVIEGKFSLSADLHVAAVKGHPSCLRFEIVEATQQACRVVVQRRGEEAREFSWTIEQARAAGLASKGVWRSYPERMLKARVCKWAVQDVFPDIIAGIAEPGEAQEIADKEHAARPERMAEPEQPRTNGHGRPEPAEPVITCEQAAKACVAVTAETDLAVAEDMLAAALAACKASVGSKADRKRLLDEFYLDAKQHVESLRAAAEASDTDAAIDRALASDDGLEG